MSVDPDWNSESPRQSKICQLDGTIFVDQKILWFQIPMQYTTLMAKEHCLDNLIGVALDQIWIHHLLLRNGVQIFLQVHSQKLKDQIQSTLLHDNILEPNNVGMVQFFQK